MSVINEQYQIMSCDAPGCDKVIAFECSQGIPKDIVEANPWVKTSRVTRTFDGRILSFCSDVCQIKSIETGSHNAPEPKQVQQVAGGGAAAIAQAAAEARRRQLATDAIKAGEPAKVSLS
jgi:hypothetical protein